MQKLLFALVHNANTRPNAWHHYDLHATLALLASPHTVSCKYVDEKWRRNRNSDPITYVPFQIATWPSANHGAFV